MPLATKAQQREYQRAWMAARRAAFFAGKTCVRCGSSDDLHIHHRDRTQKVAHQVWSWRQERRDAELAKCDVLCRGCHEQHHARQREQHGTRSRYQRGCRCELCRWAKALANERDRKRKAAA